MRSSSLSVKEKLGYGLGDTASNIVFQVVVNFMMFFYTDVFGISAAAAGTLMFALRIFDGVTDPLMGGLADRTRSRWGRYRPYLLYASIPYGILGVLAFTTPDLSENGKLIYAYITYAALMTVYTAINIPYSALGGVISDDPGERASVQSYRFAMAMVGGAIVTAATMPLVKFFGGENQVLGFQLTMGVLSLLAVVCFVICFVSTRERVEPPVEQQGERGVKGIWQFMRDFFSLFQNRQWALVAGIAFFLLILVAVRGMVTPYYVIYFLGEENLVSAFMTAGMLASVAGALLTNRLARRLCKVYLFKLGIVGVILFHALLFFVPAGQVEMAFLVFMFANFAQMIVVPLMFSMIPDTVDYGAQYTGRKNMAMAFSGHLLAIKAGLAVGGIVTGFLLDYFGYVASQAQTEFALTGIRVAMALVPVVCAVLVMVLIGRYQLDNRTMAKLHTQDNRHDDAVNGQMISAS